MNFDHVLRCSMLEYMGELAYQSLKKSKYSILNIDSVYANLDHEWYQAPRRSTAANKKSGIMDQMDHGVVC